MNADFYYKYNLKTNTDKRLMKTSKLIKSLLLIMLFTSLGSYAKAQSIQFSKREMAEIKRVEKVNYEKACKLNTIDAYKEYLNLYEKTNFAPREHIDDIKNRISDYDVWSKAKAKNTISAYQSYIRESKYKSYVTDANEAITDIKSTDEWNKIKDSASIEDINNFLANYPKTSCRSSAQNRIYELTAVNFYKSGKLLNAYKYFDLAGGKYAIASGNRLYYEKSEEYYEYTRLNESSRQFTLTSYLNKYPNSDYYNEVSNMVAIAKARNFTMNTKDAEFNSALKYAKDTKTRARVEAYIDISKKQYAQHIKNQKAARRFANGGTFMFGFEPLDFGWNGISSEADNYFDIYYYNIGFSLKIGNYQDPLQFEVGIKPGLLIVDDGYNDSETQFHMPTFARLKLNLFSMDNYKFYLSGLGYYNLVRDYYYENEFSLGTGFGLAWRKWDWHMLYYKQDFKTTNGLKNQMLGTSFIYYF